MSPTCYPSFAIAGVKIAFNTGYERRTAEQLMGRLKWVVGRDIDAMITASDVAKGRPHPDAIIKAMADLGILEPTEVLKAGDSAIDIEEGKNANCSITVGVLSGAQNRSQLEAANPTYILDSVVDLSEMRLF